MKLSDESIRQEIKYKVFFADIPKLYNWIYKSSFFYESYKPRIVNSLYFDTPNYDFASSNMSGESRRIKLRARWYSRLDEEFANSFLDESQVFNFEVKRKINSISDKLNVGNYSIKDDCFITKINSLKIKLESICKNNPSLAAYSLLSTIFTSYKREYYELKNDNKIRLTIDMNISYCDSKIPLNLLLMAKDYVIVELKFDPDNRKKINQLMADFPFRQVRSSKFLSTLAQIKRISY
tara:strand:+ start:3313 stop:4023 length:711 start_codon:yes stop_codon:yes gene_type:complete